MQSQGSQGTPAPSLLCLPLSKFSYATVSNDGVSPIPWIHLNDRNNLFAVFETIRIQNAVGSMEERRKFRVLRDPEVMEDIDLDVLAAEAQKAVAESQNPMSRNGIPSITIVVRAPCIAIRYPLAGGQIRRFQIRFTSTEDYYEAMKMLSRAKVPSTEAGTFPSSRPLPRPATSSSSMLRPSESASNIDSRPVSVSSLQNHNYTSTLGVGASAGWKSAITTEPLHGSSIAPRSIFNSTESLAQSTYGQNVKPHTDMYETKPLSTAVFEPQTISQMLPPKRDLPFLKSSSDNASVPATALRNETGTTSKFFEQTNTMRFRSNEVRTSEQKDNLSVVSAPPATMKKRKRIATPPNTSKIATSETTQAKTPVSIPATKKPRIAASRKKTGKFPVQDIAVPSVEELLQKSTESNNQDIQGANTIDTQALISRLEERTKQAAIKSPLNLEPENKTNDERHSLAENSDRNISIPSAMLPNFNKDDGPKSYRSNSIIRTRAQVRAQHENSIRGSIAEPAASNTADSNPQPAATDLEAELYSQNPKDPTTTRAKLGAASSNNLPRPSCTIPKTAIPSDLEIWANLPEPDRKAKLETWIVEQLHNDAFLQLCKTMEGTWQTLLIR